MFVLYCTPNDLSLPPSEALKATYSFMYNDQRVALKGFRLEKNISSENLDKIEKSLREVTETLVPLSHPNLSVPFGIFLPPKKPVWAETERLICGPLSPLLTGPTLENYLETSGRNLTTSEIKTILFSIAEGMLKLHCNNVIHGRLHVQHIIKRLNTWKIINPGIWKLENTVRSVKGLELLPIPGIKDDLSEFSCIVAWVCRYSFLSATLGPRISRARSFRQIIDILIETFEVRIIAQIETRSEVDIEMETDIEEEEEEDEDDEY